MYGLNAALLFKEKILHCPACVGFVRRWPSHVQELFVGVLRLLITAHTLEQCHGEERVEDHDEEDVKVSVVISLPEAGGAGGAGGHRPGAGRVHGRAAGHSCIPLLCFRSVLQDLLASGEKKEEGPVHDCAENNAGPKD